MDERSIEQYLEITTSMPPEIKPDKCALLVIDMQEYFLSKNCLAYKGPNSMVPGMMDYFVDRAATIVEPNIKKLLDVFRRNKLRVLYTLQASFEKDGSDLIPRYQAQNQMAELMYHELVWPHKDHPSAQIIDSLKPRDDEFVVIKNTISVFQGTKLELYLRNMGIEQLFVCGVVTNMCVEGAARGASELGFDVFIIDDASAAWSPELHKHTLQSFSLAFGNVMTTEVALAKINEKLPK